MLITESDQSIDANATVTWYPDDYWTGPMLISFTPSQLEMTCTIYGLDTSGHVFAGAPPIEGIGSAIVHAPFGAWYAVVSNPNGSSETYSLTATQNLIGGNYLPTVNWQALALSNNVDGLPGSFTPAVGITGSLAVLSGSLLADGQNFGPMDVLATLPAAAWPAQTIFLNTYSSPAQGFLESFNLNQFPPNFLAFDFNFFSYSPCVLQIDTSGNIILYNGGLADTSSIGLDGLSYRLA
jgi:hypothetical protein